jgi:hypothetical protein
MNTPQEKTTTNNNRILLGTKTGILDQARLRPHRGGLGPRFTWVS